MMTKEAMEATDLKDAELVAGALAGNRDAFRGIVERYQTLIASLTYSATGSLSQSEDLAQETFVRAWTQLPKLREPSKLRPWLCSIARFLISKEFRRRGREPIHEADTLEALNERTSPDPLPRDHTMNEEEETILWRSLERIPEIYREPLVLFYREQQSVKNVAQDLNLSEEVVKQRLSRGRKLLQEQVLAFIEGALSRTRPQRAFTLAVVASLPALSFSAKAAALGAAAKGAAAKATGSIGLLCAALGPIIVFVPNYLAYRVTLANAYSEEERAGIRSLYGKAALITLAMFLPAVAAVLWLTRDMADRSFLSGLLAGCLVLIFLPTMVALSIASNRKSRQLNSDVLDREFGGVFPKSAWEYCSSTKLFGLPLIHIRIGDRFADLRAPLTAWIAVGHTAVGGLFAFGAAAMAPVSIGGLSVGLVSIGGLALAVVPLGGFAVGVWPIWGVLLVGWQAFNGCFSIAWNAAVGLFALAHDFALGQFAFAEQANNEVARQAIFPNPFFRCAEFTIRHWLWLNLLWIAPFLIIWRLANKRSRPL